MKNKLKNKQMISIKGERYLEKCFMEISNFSLWKANFFYLMRNQFSKVTFLETNDNLIFKQFCISELVNSTLCPHLQSN